MEFKKGIKDSIPVGLGYFAVSFSLGIIAKNVQALTYKWQNDNNVTYKCFSAYYSIFVLKF